MDDDRKKFPRKSAPKPGARSRNGDAPRGGKPDSGKQPFRAGGAKKPFAKKPFAERAAGPDERPKRQFNKDARPRDGEARPERVARPFKAGPGSSAKPYEKRERPQGERKPFGERPEGGRKPYASRAEGADRKPYEKRERPQGERKPFGERPEGGRKPFGERPEGGRKPNASRAESPDRPKRAFAPRPDDEGQRFQRRDRPAGVASPEREGTRSFGSKSHEGQRRSYGSKNHDDVASQPFRKRPDVAEDGAGERIAKRLARAGIASRRDAEDLIAAGRVTVNGRKLDSPAFNVMPEDRIEVDGTAIPAIERTRLFLFHKPSGVVTTNRDPEGRKTVFDVLPTDLPRLMTIGRLDINTEGLLLLTNDGGLARVLELPATGWLRRYRVRVHGKVEEKALAGLKDGIAVDGVFYGSIEAALDREQGSNAWLTIGLREGKNREVKNILGALGLDVSRLIRISYGPFQLNDLPEGHVLEVKGRMLRDQLGERLVEESGANFEAGIVNPFSNQPVRRKPDPKPELVERPKVQRDGERGRIGEGGLIKKRQRREGARDDALGKLSTRPDKPKFERGDRPERPRLERGESPPRARRFGDSPDRFATFADKPGADKTGVGKSAARPPRGGKPASEQRPIEPPGQRKANVWMAPGARPIGTGRAAAEKAEVEAKRAAKKAQFRPGGKPAFGKPRGERPQAGGADRSGDGKGAPRGPRGRDADRRR
ncbi:MAG: pseudouridine synthase [Hyphomicrobiales bacterium]|nr:pseudouridine synthase [Hyphomicrobiales bacterium]